MNAGAVELGAAISQRFDLDLPPTVVFDHPTIQALANHVHSMLSHDLQPSSSTVMAAGSVHALNYHALDGRHHLHLPVTRVVGVSSVFPGNTKGKLIIARQQMYILSSFFSS